MNQTLYEKVLELKNEIESSPEVKELNRLNSLLEESPEVMKLTYNKDMAIVNFEDTIKHFGEKSKEALDAQKALAKAKLELDTNELVVKYNKQYKLVNEMYAKINKEIFSL